MKKKSETIGHRAESKTEEKTTGILSENDIKVQHSFVQSIMNNSDTMIYSIDKNYQYVNFNERHATVMRQIYNYEPKVGISILELIPVKEDREKEKSNLDRALAGEQLVNELYSGEELLSRRYFRISYSPMRIDTGEVAGAVIFAQDITDSKKTEEAMHESKERFRLIAEYTADTIAVMDLDKKFTYISPSVEKLRGYTAEETMAQSWDDIFTPPSLQKLNQLIAGQRDTILNGESDLSDMESIELEEYCKDGSTIWVDITVSAIRDSTFQTTGIITVTRDITKRKQAQEELQKTHEELKRIIKFNEALLSSIPTPVFYKDREGRYIGCNRAFSDFMGVTPDQIKGKTVFELWPEEHAEVYHIKDLELMKNPRRQIYDFKVKDKDGLEHPVIYSKDVFLNENDEVEGIVGAFMDITKRKRAEEDLQQAHEEMEQNIEQRTAELKKANEQLTALYKMGQAITAPLHLDKVLDLIAHHTARLLDSDTGVILLVDAAGETLTIRGAYGLSKTIMKETHDRIGESIAGRVVKTGQPIIANDLPNDKRLSNPYVAGEGLLACASVPIVAGGKIIGTLDIHSKRNPHAFNEEHIRILKMIAGQAAIAIENARMYEQVKHARDELEVRIQQRTSELVTANEKLQQGIDELKRIETALWESSQMLRLVLDNMPAFVFWKDRNSMYLGCNNLFAANAGLKSSEEIAGKTDLDLPWKDSEAMNYRADDRLVMDTGLPKLNYEETQLTADGRKTWVRTSKVPLRNVEGDIIGILGTFEDITERKRKDQEIAQMNRSLRMLSNSNQVLIHATNEMSLYNEICHNIVETGGYLLAWVGLSEHDERKSIRRVAQIGHDMGCLKSVDLSWADDEHGQHPCGIAIRTGQPFIVHDIQNINIPGFSKEAAIACGYKSIIALPLINAGRTLGSLGIFSGEEDAFNDKEVEILKELADDLAYGISALQASDKKRQAEDALWDSEARFSAVFHYSPVAIAIIRESDGSIIDVNEGFLSISGYSREEIIGHTTAAMGFYADPSDRDTVLKRLNEKGVLESFEFESRNKAGEIRSVISAITFIQIRGIKHYLALILDITERKKTEERLRLLGTALEAAANAIIITGKNSEIIWANEAFSKLTGYTLDDAIGRNPRDLVYSGVHSREFYKHMWETILSGNVWHGEIINKRKNGTRFHEFLTITPVCDASNNIQHFIAVKQDISKQKKFEEELKKAKEKAEESNRLKSAFLATMNHELRTPLNHILGFSDLMRSGLSTEKITDYADIIFKSSNYLLEIIESIFELALAEQSEIKLRLQTFKCLDLFISNKSVLTEILEISGKRSQIELVFNADQEILLRNITTDKNKINQVLINLFRNAVKFTKSGKIEFGLKAEQPGWLTFYVEDTGIGIPESQHKIIFEFFRQVDDSNTREYGGIGIGLAISQKIAEVMKGTLSLESKPGKGSRFYFRIPVSITTAISSQHKDENIKITVPELQERTLLIVEDDPLSMELVKKFLFPTGIKIIEAVNGKEAVEKLALCPEVILMDLNMPVMDGYTATRIIKSRKPDIPVIAITAFALTADKIKAVEAGCDGIISKPVDQRILFAELVKYLFPV